jgi:secreted trypsin-like serine protease
VGILVHCNSHFYLFIIHYLLKFKMQNQISRKIGLFLSIVLLFFNASISAEISSRIIGGTDVTPGRYPYLASLHFRDNITGELYQACGGSLIAPSVILTAAHCYHVIDVAMIGLHNLTMAEEASHETYNITSEQKVIYPFYDNVTNDGDFLLLLLDKPSIYAPIKLNADPDIPKRDALLTVMGWGTQETGHSSLIPEEATVETRSNYWCNLAYQGANLILEMLGSPHYTITENALCAEGGSKYDSCQGDSGGPLIIKGENSTSDVLVGVVSWGIGCASAISEILPGVYSRVSSAEYWIEQQIASLQSN